MDPEDIANCYFVPTSSIERAVNFLDNEKVRNYTSSYCKRDLRKLQMRYLMPTQVPKNVKVLAHQYHLALHRAIYMHDWNKLLYLLKKIPIWEQNPKFLDGMPIYIRALAILLMYHPSAQAQNLLMDYIHMVCTCRSDAEKKALMKLILTLPEKLIQKVFSFHKNLKWFQEVE